MRWLRAVNSELYRDNFVEFATSKGPSDHLIYLRRSGIAVNRAAHTVFVAQDGIQGAYTFDEVRSWNKVIETPDVFVNQSGTFQGEVGSYAATVRTEIRARARTGLFISVVDVNKPKWQVRINDETALDQWYEILNQSIKPV
jgi:hypothetical protein